MPLAVAEPSQSRREGKRLPLDLARSLGIPTLGAASVGCEVMGGCPCSPPHAGARRFSLPGLSGREQDDVLHMPTVCPRDPRLLSE